MLSVWFAGTQSYAQSGSDSLRIAREKQQKEQKRVADSAAASRKHILDSSRAAQAKYLDSVKAARQVEMDKMNAIRKKRTDSLAAIRKYKESKRYRDSVEKSKQRRLDSIQTVRKARTDSVTAARKKVTDSTIAARKEVTDSIKAIQKKRSDSLGKIRKYRESKRYADSVQVVRKLRADSIKDIREARADSLTAARKKITDSAAAARKAKADSVTAARKVITDSLAAIRKIKSDSLAKMKAKREKESKLREKQKEDKAKLALEVKIKRKQEAYNNENMLKKRWAFPRSIMQNTTTRFNYYFNANQKMDEAIENMQRFRKENYESLIPLYPFNPDRDSSVLAPDMDSIIHKASLGIQIHDPRTKWGDDLYLLLGQASYYKGDYKNATDAFKYTVSLRDKKKKKKKTNSRPKPKGPSSVVVEEKRGISGVIAHRSVHNEAILWLARVLTQQHKEGEAESVLDLVETDPNFTGSLAGRIALEKSFIRLSQQDYKGAIPPLTQVMTDKKLPDWIRRRAAFINGQLQQRYGDYTASVHSFKTVISMHPPVDMDFYSKKNLATSQMMAGGDQKDAIAMLKGILKDGKFTQYYEQVYFLLGKLSVNSGNQEDAITYLNKAITAPRSTEANKAQSYAALGDIYYGQRKYEFAKNAYDSAAVFMGENPEGEQMQTALRRSVVLGNLTTPLQTIRYNDSLLRLSEMDEKEQRAVVRRYIKMLEDRRADSLFEAENAGVNAAMKNTGNTNTGTRNNYANWYFSNAAQMQKGFNDFKQKWGSRPLADNWRRSNAGGGFVENDLSNSGNEAGGDNSGIPSEESLLAAIPKTQAQKDTALLQIRTAYVSGANAYVKDLEDYPPAIDMLDTLDRRFPKHEFDAEALYLRYMIAVKQSKFDSAKLYKAQLQSEHPNSPYTKLVQPADEAGSAAVALSVVAKYYDSTYDYLLNRYYDTSLARAKDGQRIYRQSPYQDRFQIIEATSQAMLENYSAADSVLNLFMTKHTDPNDSLKRWGEALLKYVSDKKAIIAKRVQDSLSRIDTAKRAPIMPQGEPIAAPGALPGAQGKPLAEPGAPAAQTSAAVAYLFDANEEHFAVFTFKEMEQRTKGVQVAIEDFNKFKFGSLQLQTEVQMITPASGMVVIRKFANKNQALLYVNSLKKTKQIFREYQPAEYDVLMISSSNFNKLLAGKNLDEYLRFYKSKY